MTARLRVGVAIVLWRTERRQLQQCLAALAGQTRAVDRVAILVNEDADGTIADSVRAEIPDGMAASIASSATNTGYAGGNNRLLDELFALPVDVVLVLNPDVFLAPTAVDALAGFVRGRSAPVLAGPLLELADPRTFASQRLVDTAGIRWTATGRHLDDLHGASVAVAPTEPRQVGGVSGAALCVPAAAYRRIVDAMGEFFDADFVAYREDAELGLLAARLGVESWLVPAARGLHVRTQRGTDRDVSAHVNRLSVRNRFLILFKHGRGRPGGARALVRDVVVVAGVVGRERSSLPALRDAWRLRGRMRDKHRRLERAGRSR